MPTDPVSEPVPIEAGFVLAANEETRVLVHFAETGKWYVWPGKFSEGFFAPAEGAVPFDTQTQAQEYIDALPGGANSTAWWTVEEMNAAYAQQVEASRPTEPPLVV